MLRHTFRHGIRFGAWNTKPSDPSASRSGVLLRPVNSGLSPMPIVPSVGEISPASIRSRVVLPHPDGPSSTTNSPGATSRSVGSSARTGPALAW